MTIYWRRYKVDADRLAAKRRKQGYQAHVLRVSDSVAQAINFRRDNPGYKIYVYKD